MNNYLALWQGKRGSDAHVKCIGIRGAYDPAGANKLGIYDDDFVLSIGDVVTEWKGSTDPGQYFIDHPENPRGCAQLKEGIHMFKVGIHRGRWPAFIQGENFHVNRLGPNGQVRLIDFGDFGIHLHSGGPGYAVDHYSAGCQVIWSPEGYFGATWDRFFDPAVEAMHSAGQTLMPYMLIDQTDVRPVTRAQAPSAGAQITESARSRTSDGSGTSSTSGLVGTQQGDSLDGVEQIEATREGRSLGPARFVRQVRIAAPDKIRVHQSDYAWGQRPLPDATLFLDHDGFGRSGDIIKGEASYFGKYDTQDEGTGSPAFGTIQTNSSAFGLALPKDFLLERGLAEGGGDDFHATAKGLQAMVEVYYPSKRRLVRVPIVDIGPGKKTKRPTDLTVAAAAFLQDKPEEKAKGYKLANVQVQIRIT